MSPAPASYMNGSTPTVMLLHGAFADPSSGAGVIAELQERAVQVLAPALPLRSLAGDTAYIGSVAAQFDGPVLLVGHSYGGAVATVVGGEARNVVGLVYVAGFALDEGESVAGATAGFSETSFRGFSESARRELRASGETSPRRTPDARDELTSQELQIAHMAAAGLSNNEIGQKLYLSQRTVGSHLYRMFPKLGIRSRAELHDALDPGR